MSLTTVIIDFHGIPLHVRGRYYEPELGSSAYFELESVQVLVMQAKDYKLAELAGGEGFGHPEQTVWEYLEERALECVEADFDAAECEARIARAERGDGS